MIIWLINRMVDQQKNKLYRFGENGITFLIVSSSLLESQNMLLFFIFHDSELNTFRYFDI